MENLDILIRLHKAGVSKAAVASALRHAMFNKSLVLNFLIQVADISLMRECAMALDDEVAVFPILKRVYEAIAKNTCIIKDVHKRISERADTQSDRAARRKAEQQIEIASNALEEIRKRAVEKKEEGIVALLASMEASLFRI